MPRRLARRREAFTYLCWVLEKVKAKGLKERQAFLSFAQLFFAFPKVVPHIGVRVHCYAPIPVAGQGHQLLPRGYIDAISRAHRFRSKLSEQAGRTEPLTPHLPIASILCSKGLVAEDVRLTQSMN